MAPPHPPRRNPPPPPPTTTTSRSAKESDQRAADLEQRLLSRPATGSASGSDPTRNAGSADALRVQVCELLADALLLDPSLAVRRKVPDRLWRTCFYGHISTLRAKMAKEHHRRRPKKDPRTSTTSSSATTLAALEQHLAVFLGEAITLYDYLCQRLWDRLRDECHAAASSQSSTTAAATVECLHRLSVCLGDLHRYSTSSSSSATSGSSASAKSAEAAYKLAARLGPGHGHPPNQLGVLCGAQVVLAATASSNIGTAPNPSALGLYWYARALLATHEPFETAPINLGRLFQANDDWLHAIAAGSAGKGTPPAPAATQFLAQYVQLHGLLFRLHRHRDETDRPPMNDADDGEFESLLGPVLEGFQTLLQQSALGDGLLVKLVCIQAFSEYYDPSVHGGRGRQRGAPDPPLPAVVVLGGGSGLTVAASATVPPPPTSANRLARIVTLSLGCRLADRVLAVWQQRSSGAVGGGTSAPSPAPSVRLLLPLALLTEYARSSTRDWVSGHGNDNHDPSATKRCTTLAQAFWDKMANVFNILDSPDLDVGASDLPLPTGKSPLPLPEYAELRGFLPFQAFLSDDEDSINEYASPTDALQVWADDHGAAAAKSDAAEKESTSTAAPSKGGASHRSRVLAHLRDVGWDLVQQQHGSANSRRSGLPGRLILSEHDRFTFVPSPLAEGVGPASRESLEDHDHGGVDEDDGGDDVHMDYDDPLVLPGDRSPAPTSPHVLVYQESKSGGPALLVPGALVQPPPSLTAPPALLAEPTFLHSAAAATGFKILNSTSVAETTPMEITRPPMDENSEVDRLLSNSVTNKVPPTEAMAVEPAAATVLPPPGFGPAAPLEMPESSSPFGFDPASLLSTWGGPIMSGAPEPTAAPPPTSVLESLSLYGAPGFWLPPTANPFAAPAPFVPLPPQPPSHPDGLWMVESIATGTDGSSLLDSGLLRSLRGDDEYDEGRAPTTKNPFAT